MDWLNLAIVVVLGASVGSFLSVCADRIPAGRDFMWERSQCDSCSAILQPLDLVPVASYFWLRGRCRHCGVPIPPRLVVVELIAALIYGLIWYQSPGVVVAAITAFHASLLILVAIVDLDHQLILNKITYPWAVAALGLSLVSPQLGIASSAAGGAIAFALFAAIYFVTSGGMGFGDVKLAGVVGLLVGLPLVLVALVVGVVSGGIVATALLVLGLKGRKDPVPFGVFLSTGGIVTLLWGRPLWELYAAWL